MMDSAQTAVETALKAGADYADTRVCRLSREDYTLKNGCLDGADAPEEFGVGVRVLKDGAWGFAAAPAQAREVHEVMTRLRDIGYTTTLKTLQVMTGKGLVTRDESSRAHVYTAAVGREETQRFLAGDLVDKVFGGSAAGLVAGALSAKKTSPEELAKIRQLLDDAEEEAL